MRAEITDLEPELADVLLDDQAYGLMVQPVRHDALSLAVADAPEQRPRGDAARAHPFLHGHDRAGGHTGDDRYLRAHSFLIGLATFDGHAKTTLAELQVLDVEAC